MSLDLSISGERDLSSFQVKVVRLVGVMLVLFADKKLMQHVDSVATGNVPTGIMGMLVSSTIITLLVSNSGFW